MTEAVEVKTDADIEAQMPRPAGYRILIALPAVEKTFSSGLIKADKTLYEETVLAGVGVVLDMGNQAYKDATRFPDGPWCKVGDYVLFRPNTGTRIKVNGVEYRLINDDSVEGVVNDPRGITRA